MYVTFRPHLATCRVWYFVCKQPSKQKPTMNRDFYLNKPTATMKMETVTALFLCNFADRITQCAVGDN